MSDVRIAYYAHHHGSGHVRRALEIARHLHGPITIFTSAAPPDDASSTVDIVHLPIDVDGREHEYAVSGLHYAPLAVAGIAQRMAVMADWFRDNWPCLLIVDVSVEVALLARLCAVPTVYIRQNGMRTDLPHMLAYSTASLLLAPFPESFAQARTNDEWREKTLYSGFISRFDSCAMTDASVPQTVAVLIGHGGTALTAAHLRAAAEATPDWQWTVLGPVRDVPLYDYPENLRFMGVVASPGDILRQSYVVIGSAGDNVVAEMASLQARFICYADERPFNEQIATSEILERLGLAVYCRAWPEAAAWPALLARAAAFERDAWQAHVAHGARTAATAIEQCAERVWRETLSRPACSVS
ncbi:hypothetical protein [Robbsia sp. KACC 23696]|uniref:hypothetical protein n=1 Tax=Robbsia sp. KACC 23696 TaxID=3149231 RepID=UPI00325BAB5D